MSLLCYQQVHLRSEDQGRLFAVSHALLRRLNPEADFLVLDSASPLDPRRFVTGCDYYHFKDSLGHFSPSYAAERDNPRDGPGRAHAYAWRMAYGLGYKRTFYCEADCLFSKSAAWGFQQMTKCIGCQPGVPQYGYGFDFHVVWIADIPWFVNDLGFPAKYAWETRTAADPAGEALYIDIAGPQMQALPVRGIRGETVGLCGANFHQHFPNGCDLTTHVDTAAHAEFLKMNGHADLIERL